MAAQTGIYRVKEGNKNPRKKISSNMGAATQAVRKNIDKAI
jgi:hypothetical protein